MTITKIEKIIFKIREIAGIEKTLQRWQEYADEHCGVHTEEDYRPEYVKNMSAELRKRISERTAKLRGMEAELTPDEKSQLESMLNDPAARINSPSFHAAYMGSLMCEGLAAGLASNE